MSGLVPRQRAARPVSLRCASCGAERACDGAYGSMLLAEESLLFQSEHAGCAVDAPVVHRRR